MKLSAGILVASLVGLGLAAPAATDAATSGRPAMAPRFAGMHRQVRPQFFVRHGRGNGFGFGFGGAYSTLLSGSYQTSPDEEAGLVAPPPFYGAPEFPPPPFYGGPEFAPPSPCVRPLLIHLVPARHVKLPRVVYGTPFACPG